MKDFLKAVLLILAAVLALKLLPLAFALGGVVALALVGVVALSASALAVLFGFFVAAIGVLAPIWIPVLAIIGLGALLKRSGGRPAAG